MIGQQWQIPIFSKEEGERRHRKIRELMASRGIDWSHHLGHLGCTGARPLTTLCVQLLARG